MALTQQILDKAYSALPESGKQRLSSQIPVMKKMTNKLRNFLQLEKSKEKSGWRKDLLNLALKSTETIASALNSLEKSKPEPMTPVPHHHFEVIPDEAKVRPTKKGKSKIKINPARRKNKADKQEIQRKEVARMSVAQTHGRRKSTATAKMRH